MKRISTISIAMLAATLFLTGCDNKKKEEAKSEPAAKAEPTPTEPAPTPAAGQPAADTAAPAAGAPAAGAPAAGTPAATDPTAAAPAAPTGPMPSDAEIAATVDKSLGIIEGFAAAAKANKGNCGAMADAMQKVVDENKEVLGKVKSFGANPEVGKKAQELMQKNMTRWTTAMQAMSESSANCQTDPKVQKVFEQLQM
jgi:hypothetical protein